ncbi:hypothetical protein [Alkalibacillus salilacus]|uniref:Uncharacterized protein n=1 Tax=Alkalibacillus salilacus TaxID=284582 RepID=A0ABT9VEK8_9BACI|nr:hypothetical protein [Alkalibacillus salilacus]MDQ0159400.1 hypothetical protein [Alkalibacillus salilacus]
MESTIPWNKIRLSAMIGLIVIYIIYLIGFDPHWVWGVLSFIGLIYGIVEWKLWERHIGDEKELYLIISLLVTSLGVLGYTVFSLIITNIILPLDSVIM